MTDAASVIDFAKNVAEDFGEPCRVTNNKKALLAIVYPSGRVVLYKPEGIFARDYAKIQAIRDQNLAMEENEENI